MLVTGEDIPPGAGGRRAPRREAGGAARAPDPRARGRTATTARLSGAAGRRPISRSTVRAARRAAADLGPGRRVLVRAVMSREAELPRRQVERGLVERGSTVDRRVEGYPTCAEIASTRRTRMICPFGRGRERCGHAGSRDARRHPGVPDPAPSQIGRERRLSSGLRPSSTCRPATAGPRRGAGRQFAWPRPYSRCSDGSSDKRRRPGPT